MIRTALILIAVVSLILIGATIATSDAPAPTTAQLKAKIRQQANRIADLKDERDAQDAVIADQNATITRLRARDPLAAVTSRDPDGLWAAMIAIWNEFPVLESSDFCGYDKSVVAPGDAGLTVTSYTFYSWSGC